MLHCELIVGSSQRSVESVGGVFDPVVSSAIAVFEQWWCLDWLLTATVYTKQTTGCPRWDWGASDTLILPYTFPLSFQPALGEVSAACSCCQMHSHWTEDRTGLDWLGVATPVCPPRARWVYSLAYVCNMHDTRSLGANEVLLRFRLWRAQIQL